MHKLNDDEGYFIFRRYITVKGRKVYPRKGKAFRIFISERKK